VNLWRQLLVDIALVRPTWTLRDYHSPNLIWLAEREGIARVGLVDFQDCVMGHPAYDVASLLQDARVTVPDDLELKLLGAYARLRKQSDPNFDMTSFAKAYAILGAQRATKVLGIFARLDKRDHKPWYHAHMPRVEAYLRKNLNHPALANLRGWYGEYLWSGPARAA
jgi:aminoglycoside/choline kinase family phosphotransferase